MSTRATPRPGMGEEHEHFTEAAGFMTGKSAALADWHFRKDQQAFDKLVAVLRATKWNRENLDRHRAHARKWAAENAGRLLDQARKRRGQRAMARAATPITCAGCEAVFCRLPAKGKGRGPAPEFCDNNCRQRARYRARVAREAA